MAPGRLSFYVWVQFISVLLPGVVVLTEATLIGVHLVAHPGGDLAFLGAATSRLQGAGLVMFSVVGLSGGFVIGYISRELAFWIIGRVERRRKRPAATEEWLRVRYLLGAALSDECRERHPIVARVDPTAPPPSADYQVRRAGGGHADDADLNVFLYAKLWLRRFNPSLGVDQLEAEINMLTAITVPTVLAGVDFIVLTRLLVVQILALPLALVAVVGIVQSVFRLRQAERWEALRNLAFDVAMDVATEKYGQKPVATTD